MASPLVVPLLEGKDDGGASQSTSLETVTVFEAVEIVGTLHDILVENPPRLLDVFTSEVPEEHVLRKLLRPLPKKSLLQRRPTIVTFKGKGEVLKIGDYVYAKLGPLPYRGGWQAGIHAKIGVPNALKREYYLTKIAFYDNTTDLYTVEWADECEKRNDVDMQKKSSELIFAGSRAKASGSETVLKEQGQRGTISRKNLAAFTALVLCSLCGLQAYATLLLRAPCDGVGTPGNTTVADRHHNAVVSSATFSCIATTYLKEGGATLVGCLFLLTSAATYFVVLPKMFALLRRQDEERARKWRQFLTTMKDTITTALLPNLKGYGEEIAIVAYAALVMSFALFTAIAGDSGVLALGAMAAAKFMTASNLAGEKTAILKLREQQFLDVAEQLRSKLPIAMTKEQLQVEALRFLTHKADADIMLLSAEMLILLVAGSTIDRPDSTRIRTFVVRDFYISDYTDTSSTSGSPSLMKKRDMIIDIFRRNITVPGITIEEDRFISQGCRLPFFLALQQDALEDTEEKLRELGLPTGHGAFIWRCDGTGKWLSLEAKSVEALDSQLQSLSHARKITNDLLLHSAERGIVDECREVLAAGADINFAPPSGQTALALCCKKGHVSVVQLLLEKRADTKPANRNGTTAIHLAAQKGYLKIVEILLAANADPNVANHNGVFPLLFPSGNSENHEDNFAIVQVLVEHGADLHVKSRYGDILMMKVKNNFGDEAAKKLEAIAQTVTKVTMSPQSADGGKKEGESVVEVSDEAGEDGGHGADATCLELEKENAALKGRLSKFEEETTQLKEQMKEGERETAQLKEQMAEMAEMVARLSAHLPVQ